MDLPYLPIKNINLNQRLFKPLKNIKIKLKRVLKKNEVKDIKLNRRCI